MSAEQEQDTIEIDFDKDGSLTAVKGHTTKKNLKRQMNTLKEVFEGQDAIKQRSQ